MDARRRTLLILATSIPVIACVSGGSPLVEQAPVTVSEGTHVVKEDQWFQSSFKLNRAGRVQVDLRLQEGPSVDVYFLSEAGFNKWTTMAGKGQATRGGFEHFPSLGVEGLAANFTSDWESLAAGTYYLVIENTDYGGTMPPMNMSNDIAVVEYKVLAR